MVDQQFTFIDPKLQDQKTGTSAFRASSAS